jgi:DNA polymerase
VIAHLAKEEWALEAFATHGLIYEAAASKMFGIPINEILKDSPERQKGKIGTLALGYQGGVNALITMGALNSGLVEADLQPLVDAWRKANAKIVKYWYDVQDAAIQAVREGVRTWVRDIRFFVEKDILFIELPSGRRLSYVRPRLRPGKFDKLSLSYEGMDQVKKIWCRMDTYGGKLVENIVQAFARDVMMVAFTRLTEAGYNVVMRVHDELVIEAPENSVEVEVIDKIMASPIEWAEGLPLGAEGFKSKYYKK